MTKWESIKSSSKTVKFLESQLNSRYSARCTSHSAPQSYRSPGVVEGDSDERVVEKLGLDATKAWIRRSTHGSSDPLRALSSDRSLPSDHAPSGPVPLDGHPGGALLDRASSAYFFEDDRSERIGSMFCGDGSNEFFLQSKSLPPSLEKFERDEIGAPLNYIQPVREPSVREPSQVMPPEFILTPLSSQLMTVTSSSDIHIDTVHDMSDLSGFSNDLQVLCHPEEKTPRQEQVPTGTLRPGCLPVPYDKSRTLRQETPRQQSVANVQRQQQPAQKVQQQQPPLESVPRQQPPVQEAQRPPVDEKVPRQQRLEPLQQQQTEPQRKQSDALIHAAMGDSIRWDFAPELKLKKMESKGTETEWTYRDSSVENTRTLNYVQQQPREWELDTSVINTNRSYVPVGNNLPPYHWSAGQDYERSAHQWHLGAQEIRGETVYEIGAAAQARTNTVPYFSPYQRYNTFGGPANRFATYADTYGIRRTSRGTVYPPIDSLDPMHAWYSQIPSCSPGCVQNPAQQYYPYQMAKPIRRSFTTKCRAAAGNEDARCRASRGGDLPTTSKWPFDWNLWKICCCGFSWYNAC